MCLYTRVSLCYESMYACMCPCAHVLVYISVLVCARLNRECVCDNVRLPESEIPSYKLRQFWELRHGSHVPQTCTNRSHLPPAHMCVHMHGLRARWPPSSSDSLSPLILWRSSGGGCPPGGMGGKTLRRTGMFRWCPPFLDAGEAAPASGKS